MIETKKSKAKVTIVTANEIDYAVRFVPVTSWLKYTQQKET